MKLGEKIFNLRKSKGMSQEKLAEELNVSRQAVSRWEMGTASPEIQNVIQISKMFGVTTDYLLNEEYENDEEIPCVKEMKYKMNEKIRKNRNFFLCGGFLWLYSAFCYIILSIDTLNIWFVIWAFVNIILASMFFYKFLKNKDK